MSAPKNEKPMRRWVVELKDRERVEVQGRAMVVTGRGDLVFCENVVPAFSYTEVKALHVFRAGVWFRASETTQ